MTELALENVTVLDLTRAAAGPFCTMILADLGADVIKAEPLPHGEMSRIWGPHSEGEGIYYLSINRNKRNIAVDFRSPEGLSVLRDLAEKADVVVENFKPGTCKDMGLDYESIKKGNPNVIYASITGFGSDGPYGAWPGLDQIAQAMSGMMSLTGEADGDATRYGIPIGDFVAGMWCSIGILGALHKRQATGAGERVETSLLAGLIGLLGVQAQRYLSLGEVPARIGNHHPTICPYGVYKASDGPLNLAIATDGQWKKLCKILEILDATDDPRFHSNEERYRNRSALQAVLEAKLGDKTAQEWTSVLMENSLPCGPVYSLDQVFSDPHFQHQGVIEEVEHPTIGPLKLLSNPVRYQSTGKTSVRTPPAALGEHSIDILREFGVDALRIDKLINAGVLGQAGINVK